jgi:hypothetical protein
VGEYISAEYPGSKSRPGTKPTEVGGNFTPCLYWAEEKKVLRLFYDIICENTGRNKLPTSGLCDVTHGRLDVRVFYVTGICDPLGKSEHSARYDVMR